MSSQYSNLHFKKLEQKKLIKLTISGEKEIEIRGIKELGNKNYEENKIK